MPLRDPRLVVAPVAGLFLGLIVALFIGDVPRSPAVAAPRIRPVPAPTVEAPAASPRVARPIEVRIPSIDVRAAIEPVGLNRDGSMEVPDFGSAGWYARGPRPGQPGPAVVVAHVDSYQGPDVFYRLRELRRGDRVVVRRADGTKGTWVVSRSEQTPKDDLPVARIWNQTPRPVLRLVTCGGTFNRATRHYDDNVIVYLTPTRPLPPPAT